MFAILFIYFLMDILSLPQDVFYIWSTTAASIDLSNTWHQLVSFGLPFANVAGIIGILIVINLNGFDLNVNPELMIPFIP